MGKWTALAIDAEHLEKRPSDLPTEPTKRVLSVLSVDDSPISEAKRGELVRLVNMVANYHAFTEQQQQEALEIALADHVAALECFRLLAARIPNGTLTERSNGPC